MWRWTFHPRIPCGQFRTGTQEREPQLQAGLVLESLRHIAENIKNKSIKNPLVERENKKMNDYLDINAFVDSLDDVMDFGVFGDVGNLDFDSVGIDSNEIDKADETE